MFSVRFRAKTKRNGLMKAPEIFRKHLQQGLTSIGNRLAKSAALRMRMDTGEERKSLVIEVNLRDDRGVIVYSPLLQAAIDSHGLRRGIFPPWRQGSRLYEWAQRKARGLNSASIKGKNKPPKRTKAELKANRLRRARLRRPRKIRRSRVTVPIGAKASRRVREQRREGKRLAFATARAIYRKGIKGTQWNKKALEANKKRIVQEMSNAIRRAISEMKRV